MTTETPKPGETPPAPAEPAQPGATPKPPANPPENPPAAPAGPALTPEQVEALQAAGRNWDAVKGLFRPGQDGVLELNPDVLPPPKPAVDDDPEARAAAEAEARRRVETARVAQDVAASYAEKVSADLQLQQRLRDELKGEPGGDDIFAHAQAVMNKVPIESRSEKAWRNALLLGRGGTETKRREHWIQEGHRRAMEDLEKVHKIRIPKPVPAAKTTEEIVASLTPEQKVAAQRMGLTEAEYAESLVKTPMRGGRS